jgi:RHS repeat-associated protein
MSATDRYPNQGQNYDAAGNILYDGLNLYLYDAEGRVCAVGAMPMPGQQLPSVTGYMYDGDGTRVAKGTIPQATVASVGFFSLGCDPSGWTGFQFTADYVLGPSGEQLTQFDGQGNWQRTNVYAGGKLVGTYDLVANPQYTAGGAQPAQIPWLHFHLEDALGTRRMQVSGMIANLGQPETDFQSLPFGDQLSTIPDPYADQTADDATPLHFTGKERDSESGNDYFGARYYASTMGRWLSPDSSTMEVLWPVPYADLSKPQSLNLYVYGANNPLKFRDLDGHWHQNCDGGASMSQTATATVVSGTPCTSVPDFWDYPGIWGNQARNTASNAWNRTQKVRTDVVRLFKSTKISVEAGVGEEKKLKIGGQKVGLGGSIHAKSTFTLGDLTKSTVTTEAEAEATVGVLGHDVGVEGSAGLKSDMDGNTEQDAAGSLKMGGLQQSTDETTFGGAEYDGVGGGVSVSVSTDALSDTLSDLTPW